MYVDDIEDVSSVATADIYNVIKDSINDNRQSEMHDYAYQHEIYQAVSINNFLLVLLIAFIFFCKCLKV